MIGCLAVRRAITWAMLGLYAVIASGLPLPLGGLSVDSEAAGRLAEKDRSRPFPCMNKPCGCRSATQCFTSCCCHTPAQMLAWARNRGLEPAVLAALERRAAATVSPAASCCREAAGCGDDHSGAASETTEPTSPDDTVCSDYQSLAADPAEPIALPPARMASATDDGPAFVDVVILRDALACGGFVAQWGAVCVSLRPPEPATCELPRRLSGRVTVADETLLSGRARPDTPPPRA